ncbi:MAG: 50S ribosomal protein L21 [Lachnospiraceae bacterium]|nr:50S ribosomal protein L21 [Lachnospiraceae bacterium]
MYAIIETGGKQYKVSEGDEILIEKLEAEAEASVTFDHVLAVRDDENINVGEAVQSASVTGKVIAQEKGKKVIVYRYKPKTGYHKKKGHRQNYTRVRIEKISL